MAEDFTFVGRGPIPGWEPDPNPGPRAFLTEPEGYRASDAVVRAVNVALRLERPLLLTGEPGTGKTQLAARLAAELNGGKPLVFNTRSSSQANDLFYTFDSVGYFAQSQANATKGGSPADPREFIQYVALGAAIVRSWPKKKMMELLPPEFPDYESRREVVLIDEIDKAPRDFPNDLLNQIDQMEFAVPELKLRGNTRVEVNPRLRPVVVITSNSERQLPEPFLRRCIYHHIDAQDDHISEIVDGRLRERKFVLPAFQEARRFFFALRGKSPEKQPSTSELLDWLQALDAAGFDGDGTLAGQRETAEGCLGALAKTTADLGLAREMLPPAPR